MWKPFNHFTWEQIEVSNNKMLHLVYVFLYLHNYVKENWYRQNMIYKWRQRKLLISTSSIETVYLNEKEQTQKLFDSQYDKIEL